MPPEGNGLSKLHQKRHERSRTDQRLPPKRGNPGASAVANPTPESPSTTDEVYTRYTPIPVEHIAHNPHNERETYDTDLEDMSASLRSLGQLQAIVVVSRSIWLRHRPDDTATIGPDARYVVVVGNRRLAAAPGAGLDSLWADVRDDLGEGDEHRFDDAMLGENDQRLNFDPLAYAKVLQRMVNRGSSLRKVADRVGRSHGFVQHHISLLSLIPELRGELNLRDPDTGHMRLTFTQARRIAPLDHEIQRKIFQFGAPYEPPTEKRSVTEDPAPEGEVPQERSRPRRITLPEGDPGRLAEVLRKQLTADELAGLVQLLLREGAVEGAEES